MDECHHPALNPAEIERVRLMVAPYLHVTPTVTVEDGPEFNGARLFLKLEQLQHAGSFKTRGAFANLLLQCIPTAGVPGGGIAANSLAPHRVGTLMFPLAQSFVDRVVCVEDDDIRCAQAALWERLRIVAGPGGAAAFAALLSHAYVPAPRERVVVVVSGGNTTAVDFG